MAKKKKKKIPGAQQKDDTLRRIKGVLRIVAAGQKLHKQRMGHTAPAPAPDLKGEKRKKRTTKKKRGDECMKPCLKIGDKRYFTLDV